MSELKVVIAKRKVIRKKVTVCYDKRDNYGGLSAALQTTERDLLHSYQNSLLDLDNTVFALKFSGDEVPETALDNESTICQDYQDKIHICLSLLSISSSNHDNARIDNARSLLKQPTAPLPLFNSRENEDFTSFLREFRSTTSSFTYPDRDLLLLLKQQVNGRAKLLLNSLEADKQTFDDAVELLNAAFASESIRKVNTIRQLTELKLGLADDPYSYISKFRTICESVRTLKITADDFIQYFAWSGLNEQFKKEMVSITNVTRPSCKDIKDNFFNATERYENARKVFKVKGHSTTSSFQGKGHDTTTSLAVKVNSNTPNAPKTCNLCHKIGSKDVNHFMSKCPNFPTPEKKVSKLSECNGCIKCGSFMHTTTKCSFRFRKKCYHCSGWHFSFLCGKTCSNISKKETSGSDTVNTTTNSGIAVLPNCSSRSVLPTFTFQVPGQGKLFRGLKDSGSQSTFVSERLTKSGNFKVICNDVELTVNGFNGSKAYKTRIVQLPVSLTTGVVDVFAMVVPSINIKLSLPGLGKVIHAFNEKGYSFADAFLNQTSGEINDIDVLLGSDSSHCLLGKDIIFGHNDPSVFIDTSHGIMLAGNLERLLNNMEFLHSRDSNLDCMATNSREPLLFTSSVDSAVSVCTHSFLLDCNVFSPSFSDEIQDLDFGKIDTSCNFNVLNARGHVVEEKLRDATNYILESECRNYLSYDNSECDEQTSDLNRKLIDFTLRNLALEADGRIRVPLLWNGKLSHLLSKNERLAKVILKSSLTKLKKDKDKLLLIDQTFRDQLTEGIIERIDNLEQFKAEHPQYSFLPHMAVFKPQRHTTKCRIVYLSNLRENERNKALSLSHNQCIFPGPSLNQKMSSAFMHLRFDNKLLTFDLKKAFNMLTLSENDQAKLLFFWFRNVRKDDYTLVAYRNVRLSFGLRCSPFLLMISLYYILIMNSENDDVRLKECKRLIYSLIYMDNGAYSCGDLETLQWAYSVLPKVFEPFHFSVQQMVTNDASLQSRIDEDMKIGTPVDSKLFGLTWNRVSDEIFTKPINLNFDASTKREVLTTIAAQFDIFGFNLPIMNRSRLFMHKLQCCKDLDWDKPLSNDIIREWKNICKQANSSPIIRLSRFVGPRDGTYKLIAFTDASRSLYGVVVFIYHVETGQFSFLQAKNRMVTTQLKNKSIPSLELNAVLLGVESLMELHRDLAGDVCMKPVNVSELLLYTDSICSLHWLNSYVSKMDKMQRLSIFVMNRINAIQRLCEKIPVKFCFVPGKGNPADSTTRSFSYNTLMKTNFLRGPDFNFIHNEFNDLSVVIPNPLVVDGDAHTTNHNVYVGFNSELPGNKLKVQHLIDPNDISDFRRLVLLHRRVLRCVIKWKQKIGIEGSHRRPINLFAEAISQIISTEQQLFFPEVFSYFQDKEVRLKCLPTIVTQLNVYLDKHNIIRVKSKFKKWVGQDEFPILLPRDSPLTRLIVLDAHLKLSHSGCYAVLSEIRHTYYIPKHFSSIKKILKTCVHCKRFNNRTFKLNQNVYRDFRSDPPSIPFSNVFIDYLGPFTVKRDSNSQKVWLLIFACTWSRGINLKMCNDLSVKEFLRSFQLHCFDYGIPQLVVSDLGSQLVAGANVIKDFIGDHETQLYFEENNVKPLTFQQYFKGCSKLGSLVETCVKMVKRLLFGSIKNWVLSFAEFEFIVEHTKHLVNKRPIAFKDGLREANINDVPEPITPEKLIRGYDTHSLNLIPSLQGIPEDPDWQESFSSTSHIKDEFEKLRKVRQNLIDNYHSEFLGTLVSQAIDRQDRYRPVQQHNIKVGDIVLLKEVNLKPSSYPMAIVKELEINSNGEVTGVTLLKGKTKETVKRHISTLIPYLEVKDSEECGNISTCDDGNDNDTVEPRVRRNAAILSEQRTREHLNL